MIWAPIIFLVAQAVVASSSPIITVSPDAQEMDPNEQFPDYQAELLQPSDDRVKRRRDTSSTDDTLIRKVSFPALWHRLLTSSLLVQSLSTSRKEGSESNESSSESSESSSKSDELSSAISEESSESSSATGEASSDSNESSADNTEIEFKSSKLVAAAGKSPSAKNNTSSKSSKASSGSIETISTMSTSSSESSSAATEGSFESSQTIYTSSKEVSEMNQSSSKSSEASSEFSEPDPIINTSLSVVRGGTGSQPTSLFRTSISPNIFNPQFRRGLPALPFIHFPQWAVFYTLR